MLDTAKNVNRILEGKRNLKGTGRVLVQIYEVQTPEEAEALMELGVDHIGSVLLSPEAPGGELWPGRSSLVSASGKESSLIPLFMDPDLISWALDQYRPGYRPLLRDIMGGKRGRSGR